ncbi:GOLPH3/VPS74 family protein [Amycolatopsis suaedae]|uniref:GPP34 family phosphoprotein n=1 Tax=Amycolatopsis suaedae TaxID=2510978 RepID=A0A4Q7IZG1_9PSEU|nr:GPP34 family phosphoprotein [Amycolatopsis suaedae]RZQ60440.1 GPP34 family phosphoprotein [Amycolatopsis suaedae]
MLIAEDVFLLLLDDEGKVLPIVTVDGALSSAIMLELADRLEVEEGPPVRVWVTDATPPGHPTLDRLLAILDAEQGGRPDEMSGSLLPGLRDTLGAGLAEAGMVTEVRGRKGLLRKQVTTWPAADTTHRTELQRRLASALEDNDAAPDEHDKAIIAVLASFGLLPKVVPLKYPAGARKRANHISEAVWEAADVAVFAGRAGWPGSGLEGAMLPPM